MSKVVAIVLGRDGSKGIKNKNTMKLLGRKVFQYPIMAAIKSKFIDHIFVSTDIKDLIDYANDHNISILKRPKELATDSALFEDALLNAYFQIKDILNERPKYVVVLMANAVTVNYRLIDEAIELLEDNIDADSAVTVSDFNMYSPLRARKIGENGNLIPFVPFECFSDKSQLSCDRNSQGDVYFADMGHSVCRGTTIEDMDNGLLPQKWMGQIILPVFNGDGCDMDTSWQIDMSENWLINHGFEHE